jgi:hypothetical protein
MHHDDATDAPYGPPLARYHDMEATVRHVGGLVLVIATVLCSPAVMVAGAGTTPGPLMRAALASVEAEQAKSLAPRPGRVRTDWAPVTRFGRATRSS